MYWENLNKVRDMGTSRTVSNYTDVGTALDAHSKMFTDKYLYEHPRL